MPAKISTIVKNKCVIGDCFHTPDFPSSLSADAAWSTRYAWWCSLLMMCPIRSWTCLDALTRPPAMRKIPWRRGPTLSLCTTLLLQSACRRLRPRPRSTSCPGRWEHHACLTRCWKPQPIGGYVVTQDVSFEGLDRPRCAKSLEDRVQTTYFALRFSFRVLVAAFAYVLALPCALAAGLASCSLDSLLEASIYRWICGNSGCVFWSLPLPGIVPFFITLGQLLAVAPYFPLGAFVVGYAHAVHVQFPAGLFILLPCVLAAGVCLIRVAPGMLPLLDRVVVMKSR